MTSLPGTRDPSPRRCVLAIGTSTDWCSVAIQYRDGGRPRADALCEQAGHEHSRRVLAMADSLLGAAGLSLADVDAIAFDAGPGSFTGLRIGCGVAQGLGFAIGRPLVPVASLEALAYQSLGADGVARRSAGAGGAVALAALDARMGEVYCAAYRLRPGGVAPLGPIRVLAPLVALDMLRDQAGDAPVLIAVGNAYARHEALRDAASARGIPISADPCPRADAIAAIGANRLASGDTVQACDAAPIYVRDKVALDVDEQTRLRAQRSGARPVVEADGAGR
jgi:tRNA threonylcarbamoyladenosine biosynthesis protein TsaB